MSLDLILGYTGIVSLGHAAFFGFGACAAALFAKLVMPDPTVGLRVRHRAVGAARAGGQRHHPARQRPHAADGHARHRALLLELANKLDWLTGGADGLQGVVMGPVLGLFEFDLYGRTAASVFAGRDAGAVPASCAGSCIRPSAPRSRRSATTGCAPCAIGIPVVSRLAVIYTRGGRRGRRRGCAARADHRLRLARRAGLRPLGRRAADAGDRRRGLALRRRRRAPSSSSCCRTRCRR